MQWGRMDGETHAPREAKVVQPYQQLLKLPLLATALLLFLLLLSMLLLLLQCLSLYLFRSRHEQQRVAAFLTPLQQRGRTAAPEDPAGVLCPAKPTDIRSSELHLVRERQRIP